ncbi:2,4-dihydroxyhept-2-ene-1,7-dioic acid aldolase [Mycobacterium basiliense]|uniref:2,4-dihydroxyhept-2-ene-1,7-dioic acid aldolase n=1 Tax=Mycobacterium basiliense TaxID=2094119 RepID=A0A3S4FPL4_9MYCO|nr:2,4-dihydroxyhept-2-ene-1,7-dioic acid aldolase [Mycobacterium basiliense]
MTTAGEARAWAPGALRGIGDSLYTLLCGADGDDIDWDAYSTLVRYCVSDMGHPMLWCTSGIAEFWSLTLDERKSLLEVAIDEGRRANSDVIVQACTSAMTANDCLELTLHAQQTSADIAYLQTPVMEVHGGEGVLRFWVARSSTRRRYWGCPSGYFRTPGRRRPNYHPRPRRRSTTPTAVSGLRCVTEELPFDEGEFAIPRGPCGRCGMHYR